MSVLPSNIKELESAPPRSGSDWSIFPRTPKGQVLLMFLALIAITAPAEGAWSAIALHVGAAALAAGLVDAPFVRLESKRWQFPTSAVLTGLIVAMILAPTEAWYMGVHASVLAIATKRVIRTQREHVFNPAAIALLWVGAVFGAAESWWGALANISGLWLVVLVALGVVIVERLNKFPLVLSFAGAYFGLWTAISFQNPQAAAEMFRAPFLQAALFLAFFMLTDPPTSPNLYGEQVVFGVVVAGAASAAQLVGAGQLYLIIGLLTANAGFAAWRAVARRRTPRPSRPAAALVTTPVMAEYGRPSEQWPQAS